jgi:general L-amino acid transport system permease protein
VQIGLVAVVAGILAYLFSNLVENMRRQGIDTGFGYLNQPAEFTIPGSDFRKTQTRWAAILVGVANTFRVAFAGIILATILGVLLGIARLSKNWLINTGAKLYVEFFRNIPLLVIIVFTYLAVFLQFPTIDEAAEPFGLSVISVRGIHIPWYEGGSSFRPYLVVLLGAVIIGVLVAQYRTRLQDTTGVAHHRVLWGGGVFLLIAAAGYAVLGSPFAITTPVLADGLVDGGIRLPPEYAALLIALVIYTASHIGEITRASIQSVHVGQREAAMALALSGFQRMRYVILPQAFRVAIPPLANQYLNLTKNSSLAIAIAYFELTKVTNDLIANGGPAPQSFVLLMLIYLVISLGIAAVTNYFNQRMALVER